MRAGVGSSDAVVSCLGGDGGRTPPEVLFNLVPIKCHNQIVLGLCMEKQRVEL